MADDPERAWRHPWLQVSRLTRDISGTLWSTETWPTAKAALDWALAERATATTWCVVELKPFATVAATRAVAFVAVGISSASADHESPDVDLPSL